MKYLKRFNESNIGIYDLKSYSKENLAFLLDKGFTVDVSYTQDNPVKWPRQRKVIITEIRITKIKDPGFFKWEDVKYDIIPFLILLNEIFVIDDINISIEDDDPIFYELDEIEDDDTQYLDEISVIEFKILRKKETTYYETFKKV